MLKHMKKKLQLISISVTILATILDLADYVFYIFSKTLQRRVCSRVDDTVNLDIIVSAATLDLYLITLCYIIFLIIFLEKNFTDDFIDPASRCWHKDPLHVQYIWRYSTILIAVTILAAILDFTLIAGLWNIYPRYFLPSGDIVIKKTKICCTHNNAYRTTSAVWSRMFVLFYVDDIVVISKEKRDLRLGLEIVENYSKE